VCLLSALRFHDLTTQNPSEVWLAIDRKARTPAERELPLRIVRFSGKARLKGIEEHEIDGVKVRIYTRQDRGRLLQVSPEDRHGRRAGGAPRLLAFQALHDG
jgi:hypothetical protein